MNDMEPALSVRLYDVMAKIGVSEKTRKLYQDSAITKEIIQTITYQIDSVAVSKYIFGSSCEGTTTYDMNSDIDCVYCAEDFPVIDDINRAPPGTSFLMVRDDHTYPGYVKLQKVIDGIPLTIDNTKVANGCNTDNIGRICVKQYFSNMHNDERHGPAETTPAHDGLISIDKVKAMRINTIPLFVREWLYRRRQNYWPSRDALQTMSRLGCFFVGVGHLNSQEFDIEWRLSFSLQERLLMFSFNQTQHKCYIVLKMLKTEMIQQRVGESISSYHCKTCMFYAIENTKTKLWKPHKLLRCVRVCLMILLTWVHNGYCPNYFVPTENMFERPRRREIKDDLVKVLRELVTELPAFIIQLQCDIVGKMITHQNIISLSKLRMRYGRLLLTVGSVSFFSHSINMYCYKSEDTRYTCLNILNHIKRLKTTSRITEHTEQQTRDAISLAIPALHLQLAQRLASFAFTTEGAYYCQTILQFSLHHFREGHSTDLFSSRLLIVSLLMRLQMYGLSSGILQGAANSLELDVISCCFCTDTPNYINVYELLKSENISTKHFCESNIVTCVRFLPCDTEITPDPLRAEMFRSNDTPTSSRDNVNNRWFDWAVVDGKVYVWFLQYLLNSKLNRHSKKHFAIVNLFRVLFYDPNLGHRETGYNLLGWIYVQEGRHQDAILCFQTSWKIRPHHNAAKFHIRNVPLDLD